MEDGHRQRVGVTAAVGVGVGVAAADGHVY